MTEEQKARIEEIMGRVELATDGEWCHAYGGLKKDDAEVLSDSWGRLCVFDHGVGAIHDAAFAAHSRQDIPFLLQLVQELEVALRRRPQAVGTDAIRHAQEFADVMIRIGDLCGRMGWDLEDALMHKMGFNKARPFRHGGKKA